MIRLLDSDEPLPLKLMLLADPSEALVDDYKNRAECYVMEVDSVIAGEYMLLPTRPGTIEIVNVAVDERFQGRGYGRSLVTHAVETAKRKGYKTIEIGTGNSSVVQLALYQKCGFRITSVDRDYFIRHYKTPIFENSIQVTDMVRLSQDL